MVEKIFLKNLKKTSYKSKKISQLVSEGKNLTNLEKRIDIQQVHSWSGAKAPSRMKVRHELPAHKGYHGKQGW